ncbi:DarT ssDNA thymidine ADP-ribosyltransferase family protein, partial [Klebsiella pneumoniae]|uniref:DarT ssDNA thymidine ADP-ribosyltransferase family protein n=1 Tax=Klebsiella pneumoniae TaxID=573 RepID=UPI003871280F
MSQRNNAGTVIGMNSIKQRRLTELTLDCYPDLYIGQCVPFYFCPRSVMLYLIHRGDHPDLGYHGGQDPVLHLEADLFTVMDWAERNRQRWAFTLSNAGALYVES